MGGVTILSDLPPPISLFATIFPNPVPSPPSDAIFE